VRQVGQLPRIIWQYCLLITARILYMFRTFTASVIRSI